MQYIRQPDPLAALPGTISSAFSEGMKDAQVRKAFQDELVLRGFEMAPEGMTPETAQKEGYQKTSFGFLRKKAPETEIRHVARGALGPGSRMGLGTYLRDKLTGFTPTPGKDRWITDSETGGKFQVPSSEAREILGRPDSQYLRGQVAVTPKERMRLDEVARTKREQVLTDAMAKRKHEIALTRTKAQKKLTGEMSKVDWEYTKNDIKRIREIEEQLRLGTQPDPSGMMDIPITPEYQEKLAFEASLRKAQIAAREGGYEIEVNAKTGQIRRKGTESKEQEIPALLTPSGDIATIKERKVEPKPKPQKSRQQRLEEDRRRRNKAFGAIQDRGAGAIGEGLKRGHGRLQTWTRGILDR